MARSSEVPVKESSTEDSALREVKCRGLTQTILWFWYEHGGSAASRGLRLVTTSSCALWGRLAMEEISAKVVMRDAVAIGMRIVMLMDDLVCG